MIEAYQAGQASMTITSECEFIEFLVDKFGLGVLSDDAMMLCANCGRRGLPMPERVRAWRYGKIPQSGRSYNHRDDYAEAGVSVMALVGQDVDVADEISAMMIKSTNRPIVVVEGLLHYRRGSDGEPLIVGAVEVQS